MNSICGEDSTLGSKGHAAHNCSVVRQEGRSSCFLKGLAMSYLRFSEVSSG